MKKFQVDTGDTLTIALIAYYKLEDVSDYWDGFDLTNYNSVSFVAGKVNKAASFDGLLNYLLRNSVLSSHIDNISMFCWVYLPSDSEKGAFAHNGSYANTGNNGGYSFGVGDTSFDNLGNHLILLVDNVAWCNFNENIGTGWHFVGVVRDSGTWKGYIDGVECALTFGNEPQTPGSNFMLATNVDTNPRLFGGKIDEFGFWEKALNNTEISDLYNGGDGQTMIEEAAAVNSFLAMF